MKLHMNTTIQFQFNFRLLYSLFNHKYLSQLMAINIVILNIKSYNLKFKNYYFYNLVPSYIQGQK